MANIKMKPLLLTCLILLAFIGCSIFVEPLPKIKSKNLVISVDMDSYEGLRKTYTPDVSIYDFGEIIMRIYREVEAGGEITRVKVGNDIVIKPYYDSLTVELMDLPYDTYIITAQAYINSSVGNINNFVAYGEQKFTFSASSTETKVMMDLIVGPAGSTGTLRYKLINAIGLPVEAVLYPLNDISEEAKMILTQGLNPLDPVGGWHTKVLASGYYVFFFGETSPNIVHIYKDLVTVLQDQYTIYGSLTTLVNPKPASDVKIFPYFYGTETLIEDEEILSYGTEVTVKIANGNVYRYVPGSIKLNNGFDNAWFISPEVKNPDGTYSRTFRMPARDITVSVDSEIIPEIEIGFKDPNMADYIRFVNVSDNNEIDFVNPGQAIKVVFDDPNVPGLPFALQSWWLDITPQANTGFTFTVPSPCSAWSVTAIVTIGNVPHSVSIPIGHN